MVDAANKNGAADYHLLHTVTLREFSAQQRAKITALSETGSASGEQMVPDENQPQKTENTKNDTPNDAPEQNEKVQSLFEMPENIEVTSEPVFPQTYEDAADLLENREPEFETGEITYSKQEPQFGIPQEWKSDDVGEPIRQAKEVDEDEEAPFSPEDTADVSEPQFGIPEHPAVSDADLKPDDIAEVKPVFTTHYPQENTLLSADIFYDEVETDLDL
jgi:hypothetical protein